MRKIKYRGKRIDNGEWVCGFYLSNPMMDRIVRDFALVISEKYSEDGLNYCSGSFYDVHSASIGQFTGLKDKNGKDIYEGDIIALPEFYETPEMTAKTYIHMQVVFSNCAFQLSKDGEVDLYEDNLAVCFVNNNEDFEIIGDIYTTPELITNKNK